MNMVITGNFTFDCVLLNAPSYNVFSTENKNLFENLISLNLGCLVINLENAGSYSRGFLLYYY